MKHLRLKKDEKSPDQIRQANRHNALDIIARKAGFDDDAFAHTEFSLMNLFDLIVEECAVAAELSARNYSGDGNESTGSIGAAAAVRAYGKNLGNTVEPKYIIGPGNK